MDVNLADQLLSLLEREVTADQVQRISEELRDANLIMRKGHGVYAVTDPFVQTAWRERGLSLGPRPHKPVTKKAGRKVEERQAAPMIAVCLRV